MSTPPDQELPPPKTLTFQLSDGKDLVVQVQARSLSARLLRCAGGEAPPCRDAKTAARVRRLSRACADSDAGRQECPYESGGLGCRVWGAAHLLAAELAKDPSSVAGLSVLGRAPAPAQAPSPLSLRAGALTHSATSPRASALLRPLRPPTPRQSSGQDAASLASPPRLWARGRWPSRTPSRASSTPSPGAPGSRRRRSPRGRLRAGSPGTSPPGPAAKSASAGSTGRTSPADPADAGSSGSPERSPPPRRRTPARCSATSSSARRRAAAPRSRRGRRSTSSSGRTCCTTPCSWSRWRAPSRTASRRGASAGWSSRSGSAASSPRCSSRRAPPPPACLMRACPACRPKPPERA